MKTQMIRRSVAAGLLAVGAAGCVTTEADRMALLGTAAGAGAGAVLGHNFGGSDHDRTLGAIAGAAVGGVMARQYGREREMQSDINQLRLQQSVVTIWVPNANGSRVPVTLRATDGGQYIGPRGEYYPGLPTDTQLAGMYAH